MIIIEKVKPTPTITSVDEISLLDAFVIGIAQCFALIPGVSRSGATILASMMRKIDVTTSADFSFLIAVPVITIATVYEFLKSFSTFNSAQSMELLVGFIISFVVAIGAIKGFLMVLKRLSLTPFAIYRIIAGILFYLIWLR
jgi:undecaprenyl-diphosphatase